MARNRFEQVDEVQPDAINLTLSKHDDKEVGVIHVPKSASGQLPISLTSEEMPILSALSGAITLANKRKLAIVVIDPQNLWKSEWGDLWRYEESDGGDGPGGAAN